MTVVFPRPQGNLIILKLDFPSSPQTDKLLFDFFLHTSCTVTRGTRFSKSSRLSNWVPSVITLAAPAATPKRNASSNETPQSQTHQYPAQHRVSRPNGGAGRYGKGG